MQIPFLNSQRYHFFKICGLLTLLLIGCSKEGPGESPSPEEPIIDVTAIPNDPWWNDAVFYEVFVRSFYDSNADGVGDIRGLIQKLDYLNDGDPNTTDDLGVTGIWLMPVFPSPSYHGYDVTDYRDINPDYGNLNDFRELVNQAHARGIKVIIDFVGNHTSDQHPWFQASAEGSSKRNWYRWTSSAPDYNGPWGQTVWHERNNSYYYGIFWGGMPDLNYTNQEVTNEIKNTIRYWYNDIGVDGFRIDAVKHWIENGSQQENTSGTLQWWREFYAFQKSIHPALMTVGEAWTSTQNIVPYTDYRLDYCFEFDLANEILNAVINQNPANLKSKLNEVLNAYPAGQFGSFLTNHDQDRSFNRLGQNPERAKLAASLLLSFPGIPYLYYGEEIGMTGQKPDEFIRTPMQWSSEAHAGFSSSQPWQNVNGDFATTNVNTQKTEDTSLWRHYQKWIGLRNQNEALRTGQYIPVNSSAGAVFSFARKTAASTLLVVHHFSSQERDNIPLSGQIEGLAAGTYDLIDLLTNSTAGTLTVGENGSITGISDLPIQGYSSFVFSITPQ